MADHIKDLHRLKEDERIRMIGEAAAGGGTVGVMLEKNEPGKVDRYIKKVLERYPTVCVLERIDGPTSMLVTVKFGKLNS